MAVPIEPQEIFGRLAANEDSGAIGAELVERLLCDRFGLSAKYSTLTAERDQNFRVTNSADDELVLKIFGASQPPEEALLLAAVLDHIAGSAPWLPVPRLASNASREVVTEFTDEGGCRRIALAYSFLKGVPAFDAPRSAAQHRNCGSILAELAIALKSFSHPFMRRPLVWDLQNVPALEWLVPRLDALAFQPFVMGFLEQFSAFVAPRLARLPQQFVHNDLNARNIIVDPAEPSRVTGIIDFGDAVYTARIADVAVGVIGQLSSPDAAPSAMEEFVHAYQSVNPLTQEETALLPWMVAARIVQNVVITTWYRQRDPQGDHFAAFGPDFFRWRIEFAQRLISEASLG